MNYLTLAEAAARLPSCRSGKKVHVKTVKRWIVRGVRGVCLSAVRIGSGWFTTEQWLDEFTRRCTDASSPPAITPSERMRQQRRRNAIARLAKHGIKVRDKNEVEGETARAG